jgi:hypothetical protein
MGSAPFRGLWAARASDYSHYGLLKSYCSKASGHTTACARCQLWNNRTMRKRCIKRA